MTNEQQALLDMPIWLVIVLALVGGVSGEMWRADKEGARGWSLLRRLALRSGACVVCGVSAIMLLYAAGVSIWTACAFGCLPWPAPTSPSAFMSAGRPSASGYANRLPGIPIRTSLDSPGGYRPQHGRAPRAFAAGAASA